MKLLKNNSSILAVAGLTLLALCGCAPREKVYGAVGKEAPILRDFPADFQLPVSNETEQPIGGFGGDGGGSSAACFIDGSDRLRVVCCGMSGVIREGTRRTTSGAAALIDARIFGAVAGRCGTGQDSISLPKMARSSLAMCSRVASKP